MITGLFTASKKLMRPPIIKVAEHPARIIKN
jgi:hypothetical protein